MALSGDILALTEDLQGHHNRRGGDPLHPLHHGHAGGDDDDAEVNDAPDDRQESQSHPLTDRESQNGSDGGSGAATAVNSTTVEISSSSQTPNGSVEFGGGSGGGGDGGMVGELPVWEPSGNWWHDLLHFCGPGWLVSIAYVDPGNYQADIQAGATTRYSLLWTVWWTSMLSIYVQVLCVRLGYRTQLTLAQVQAQELKQYERQYEEQHGVNGSICGAIRQSWRRYLAWFVAEFSVVLTDLPEVIGFGIACNLFFGWPYWIGVLCSLVTTMVFLATMNFGIRNLEMIIFVMVGIMSIALFVEMGFVSVDGPALIKGWVYGFVDATPNDLFAIVGILGAVVMPHNLYLHSGTVQTRKVKRTTQVVDKAILYCSWEPVLPIVVSFFVNMAVVSIAAESVFGTPNAENVGLTDFCSYFQSLRGGCVLWGVALLSAGQSSAITTTFTGQFIMDGYLELRLPVKIRAVVTRLIAITPCVLIAAFLPNYLNQLVNIVNASLAFLLPFALSPLIKYNCSEHILGDGQAAKGVEKIVMYAFGFLAWSVNAISLSTPGGGFFGDYVNAVMPWSAAKVFWIVVQIGLQIFYAWWNYFCLFAPLAQLRRRNSRLSLVGDMEGDGVHSSNHNMGSDPAPPESASSELPRIP